MNKINISNKKELCKKDFCLFMYVKIFNVKNKEINKKINFIWLRVKP